MSNFSIPLLVADANANLLWLNDAAKQFFGDSPLRTLSDAFLPDTIRSILACQDITLLEQITSPSAVGSGEFSLAVVSEPSCLDHDERFIIAIQPHLFGRLSLTEREDALITIAHDLKNPLGAIFGFADALLDTRAGDGLNETQREILARIRSTASRSIDLVRNFQHLSQLDSPLHHASRSTELNATVVSVINYTWREYPDEPPVHLSLSATPLAVAIDRILLERILTNLYSNALKFTPRDGAISITTESREESALFIITNSAPLIADDELNTIFDRHTRGNNSRGIPGSGLGLYIVKQILQKIGGGITVASSEKAGTSFTVTLPLVKASHNS